MESFWNLKKKKTIKRKPNSIFKKESTKQRKLSKYGDADLDGTPNVWDCKPRNPAKDGVAWQIIKSIPKAFSNKTTVIVKKPIAQVRSPIFRTYKEIKKPTTPTTPGTTTPTKSTLPIVDHDRKAIGGDWYYTHQGWKDLSGMSSRFRASFMKTVRAWEQKEAAKRRAEAAAAQAKYQRQVEAASIRNRPTPAQILKDRTTALSQTAKGREILLRKQQLTKLGNVATRQKFRTLKQRKFEEEYPGYYYNEEYF